MHHNHINKLEFVPIENIKNIESSDYLGLWPVVDITGHALAMRIMVVDNMKMVK